MHVEFLSCVECSNVVSGPSHVSAQVDGEGLHWRALVTPVAAAVSSQTSRADV